jgi:hypothetical protein
MTKSDISHTFEILLKYGNGGYLASKKTLNIAESLLHSMAILWNNQLTVSSCPIIGTEDQKRKLPICTGFKAKYIFWKGVNSNYTKREGLLIKNTFEMLKGT